jgi:hypothetical protein
MFFLLLGSFDSKSSRKDTTYGLIVFGKTILESIIFPKSFSDFI